MPLEIPITIPDTEYNGWDKVKLGDENDLGQNNKKNKRKIEVESNTNIKEHVLEPKQENLKFPAEADILKPIDHKESSKRIRLCSFNAHKKIEPTSFSVWANILRSTPRAVLILLDAAQDVKENLLDQARYQVRDGEM